MGDTPEAGTDEDGEARGGDPPDWMKASELTVSAVQCWTSIEEFLGIGPCTVMSMMSENLIPSACEVDVRNAEHVRADAGDETPPSALLDWNNNYGDNPDKAVCFHCSNLPKRFFKEGVKMDYQLIIAGTVGKENTHGTLDGTVKAGADELCVFLDRRLYRQDLRVMWAKARSRMIHSILLAGRVWWRFRRCRICCGTSARTALSIMLRRSFSTTAAPVYEAATKYLELADALASGKVLPRRQGSSGFPYGGRSFTLIIHRRHLPSKYL